MNRRMFVLGALLLFAGCKTTSDFRETRTLTATVKYSTLEGGFFYLHGDDGRDYDPTNLPSAYQTDGKRVKVKFVIREDLGSIHMMGIIVEIVEISSIP
jgi:hypothetical protein